MSDLFEQGKIDRCDLLKVDIEGAEHALFASTPAAIWDKIQRVVMEAHPMNGKGAKDLMELLGRQGFLVSQKGHLLWAVRAANA